MAHKPCNASTKGPLDPLFDSIPDPILRAVIKEPIAFWGGVFAGALGLSVTEDPLKSWIQRTSGSGAGEGGGRPGSGGVAVSTQVQHRDEPVLKR
ncbi:hypothetical protein FOA52_001321 [Chlamydomonas sp. UWO 241]|nr:hypothetical protein FOA52_001321 [Chlamydomonas sp. UWO 241]